MTDTISKSISLSTPVLGETEWHYVRQCLESGWISTSGPLVEKFEQQVCMVTGAKYAVACSSGTAALHISLIIAGVELGDEVIVPTVTFIAPVNAVKYVGAEPVFMDCDEYFNIDADKTISFIENETYFENAFTYNYRTRRRIRAIIPVHVLGNAVDMQRLLDVCRERNIAVVEDASESLGTFYTFGKLSGRYTGTIGDVGCYSFNANKIVTAGGGGMIVTGINEYAERAKYLTTQAKDDSVKYIHNEVGYNYRLTNIHAAIGVAQLERLSEYIEIRRKNFDHYKKKIVDVPGLQIAEVPFYACNNHWLTALVVNREQYGHDRDEVIAYLAAKGIESRPLWYPDHMQRPYRNSQTYAIEKAPDICCKTLLLPSSAGLDASDLGYMVEVLKQ
jgi:aminotransferase in exopolysaccharide biosynthesis